MSCKTTLTLVGKVVAYASLVETNKTEQDAQQSNWQVNGGQWRRTSSHYGAGWYVTSLSYNWVHVQAAPILHDTEKQISLEIWEK